MSDVFIKSNFFIFIEILGSLALFAGLLLPTLYFNYLPEEIPIHYNFSGQPDSYGPKLSLWILPLVSAFLFAGLHLLPKLIEHQKPKPTEDTHTFKLKQRGVLNLLTFLKSTLAIAFTYLILATIMTALDKWSGLGRAFMPLFLIAMIVIPVAFAIRMGTMK